MIMGKSKKQYIGAIEDEREAAQTYDWHAVMMQGIRVCKKAICCRFHLKAALQANLTPYIMF